MGPILVILLAGQTPIPTAPLPLDKPERRPSLIEYADPPPVEDLRGHAEKIRDLELIVHYRKLAVLHYLLQLATHHQDRILATRVDYVLRQENERFHRAMMDLHQLSLQGLPPLQRRDVLPYPGMIYRDAYAKAQKEITLENAFRRLREVEKWPTATQSNPP